MWKNEWENASFVASFIAPLFLHLAKSFKKGEKKCESRKLSRIFDGNFLCCSFVLLYMPHVFPLFFFFFSPHFSPSHYDKSDIIPKPFSADRRARESFSFVVVAVFQNWNAIRRLWHCCCWEFFSDVSERFFIEISEISQNFIGKSWRS